MIATKTTLVITIALASAPAYAKPPISEFLARAYFESDVISRCAGFGVENYYPPTIRFIETKIAERWPDKAAELFRKAEASAARQLATFLQRKPELAGADPKIETLPDIAIQGGRSGSIEVPRQRRISEGDPAKARLCRQISGPEDAENLLNAAAVTIANYAPE